MVRSLVDSSQIYHAREIAFLQATMISGTQALIITYDRPRGRPAAPDVVRLMKTMCFDAHVDLSILVQVST